MVQRTQIVERARWYIGSPFRHQGRWKRYGLDCLGLILAVGADLELTDALGKPFRRNDYVNYGRQPIGDFLLKECQRRLIDVESIRDGDVLVIRNPRPPCHLAIATTINGALGAVHSTDGHGCREHRLDADWKSRIVAQFCFPDVG